MTESPLYYRKMRAVRRQSRVSETAQAGRDQVSLNVARDRKLTDLVTVAARRMTA